MKVIHARADIIRPQILDDASREAIYNAIEIAGRTCYKTESKMGNVPSEKFVKMLVKRGHEAMLEHANMTVRFTVDRGISHEIVRHRLASFAQESTRYCNYSDERFGNELTFIAPCVMTQWSESWKIWLESCIAAERSYFALLDQGEKPEIARNVLPMSLKTELVMTANMREWRHFLKLRALGTSGTPHPQMREVAEPLLKTLKDFLPALFGDLEVKA